MLVVIALVFGLAGMQTAYGSPAQEAPDPRTPGPEKVYAGVYISNIQRVDVSANSFDADFYVWLRWNNPGIDPTKGLEVMNPYQAWGLVRTPVHKEPQKQDDGSLLWLVRYQGSFNAPLSLADYPFETQTLRLIIEDGVHSVGDIVYEADQDPIALDREVTLPGYRFGQPRIAFSGYTYDSSFGQRGATAQDRTYPRMTVDIPLSSPAVSGIVKTIVPLGIVLIASALALVIPASYVDSKLIICITALLALIAMHWGVSSGLPNTNYLLMVDVLYILAYAAATAMLAACVIGAWALKSRGDRAALALERRALVLIGMVFLTSSATVLLLYLPD